VCHVINILCNKNYSESTQCDLALQWTCIDKKLIAVLNITQEQMMHFASLTEKGLDLTTKTKFHPRTGLKKAQRGSRDTAPLFL
jgi:hypothetical protein